MVAAVLSMRRIKHEIVSLCRIGAKLTIEIVQKISLKYGLLAETRPFVKKIQK